jgi:hypothetical protein
MSHRACGEFAYAEAQIPAQVRRGIAATASLELFKDVVHVVLDGRQLDAQSVAVGGQHCHPAQRATRDLSRTLHLSQGDRLDGEDQFCE